MRQRGHFVLTALASLLFFQVTQTNTQAKDPTPATDTRVIGLPTRAQGLHFLKTHAPDLTSERFQRWSGVDPDQGLGRDVWQFADGKIFDNLHPREQWNSLHRLLVRDEVAAGIA